MLSALGTYLYSMDIVICASAEDGVPKDPSTRTILNEQKAYINTVQDVE